MAEFFGTIGSDSVVGTLGDDVLQGGPQTVVLVGPPEVVLVRTEDDAGNDTLIGGGGRDSFIGYAGIDLVIIDLSALNLSLFYDWQFFSQNQLRVGANVPNPFNPAGSAVFEVYGFFGGIERLHFISGSGSDVLSGFGLADTLVGNDGNDVLYGDAGNDSLDGGAGDDYLDAATGNDTLSGGAGVDTARIDRATVTTSLSFTAAAPSAVIRFDGASITGIERFEVYGGSGADTLRGGADHDHLYGNAGSDSLAGGAGDDGLYGGEGSDTLVGGGGKDLFLGNDPFNTGESDADQGIDLAIVDHSSLTISLISNVYNVFSGIERLQFFSGSGSDVLFGFGLADTLVGNGGSDQLLGGAGNDSLDGGAGDDYLDAATGNDTLSGGAGVDTARIDRATVTTSLSFTAAAPSAVIRFDGASITGIERFEVYAGSGADTLRGGADRDVLYGNAGSDSLQGGAGIDWLSGDEGNDTVVGGTERDTLFGGTGNDTFILAAGNVLIEYRDEGIDTVQTTLTAYTIDPNIENLVAVGAASRYFVGNTLNNAVAGNIGADVLIGDEGSDTLSGLAGNDTLDGGFGTDIDRLIGGLGDDVYLITAGDVVVEALNQGIDTVLTGAATFTLGLNIENLTGTDAETLAGFVTIAHTLTGNGLANVITGNWLDDTLIGAAGDDTLDGSFGGDRLVGGIGNDLYLVDTGDVVIEAANQGRDTVRATTGTSFTLSPNLEVLILEGDTLVGGVGNILDNAIVGNAGSNVLYGLAGADTLMGEGGADILIGGAGRDTLTGGAGNDQFRIIATTESTVAAPDLILDFSFAAATGFDRVDLRAIDANTGLAGNQAFTYRGANFTGAAGDLRVQTSGSGIFVAAGDVNGDSVADFVITIESATGPGAAWFLL